MSDSKFRFSLSINRRKREIIFNLTKKNRKRPKTLFSKNHMNPYNDMIYKLKN